MSRIEWLQLLSDVARDPESAPGPRVRALELIGRELGYVKRRSWLRRRKEET